MSFLCIDFVNSSWYSTHHIFKDPLGDNIWIIKLADKWSIGSLSAPTADELAKLIEMRSHFLRMFNKLISGSKLIDSDISIINGYMSDISFYKKLYKEKDSYKLKDVPREQSWSWFMAEAAASLSKMYASGSVDKLKSCQNPDCGWFFLDESKSGNRKWCEDSCATLMKVRRFRQKQKQNQSK